MSRTLDNGHRPYRQTTILMNHPLGAVEHCVVQDYTVTSNQGNGEKGRQIAGLCTRSIDLYTFPQGWRAGSFIPTPIYPRGPLHRVLAINLVPSSHDLNCSQPGPVIGVIEKVTNTFDIEDDGIYWAI